MNVARILVWAVVIAGGVVACGLLLAMACWVYAGRERRREQRAMRACRHERQLERAQRLPSYYECEQIWNKSL